MNYITDYISRSEKPKLIALTCVTTLVAPYIISAIKSKLM